MKVNLEKLIGKKLSQKICPESKVKLNNNEERLSLSNIKFTSKLFYRYLTSYLD